MAVFRIDDNVAKGGPTLVIAMVVVLVVVVPDEGR